MVILVTTVVKKVVKDAVKTDLLQGLNTCHFAPCSCRRMEKISWTDHVRNEEVLLRVNEQRNILHEIRKGKANWIGHILRRNCLQKQVIEGKIQGEKEVTRRRGRRHRKLWMTLRTGEDTLI